MLLKNNEDDIDFSKWKQWSLEEKGVLSIWHHSYCKWCSRKINKCKICFI